MRCVAQSGDLLVETVTKEQFYIPGHRLAARSLGSYWRGGRIYFAIGCYRHSWVCDRKVQVFRKGRLTREKPERCAAACKTGLGRAPGKTRLNPTFAAAMNFPVKKGRIAEITPSPSIKHFR